MKMKRTLSLKINLFEKKGEKILKPFLIEALKL